MEEKYTDTAIRILFSVSAFAPSIRTCNVLLFYWGTGNAPPFTAVILLPGSIIRITGILLCCHDENDDSSLGMSLGINDRLQVIRLMGRSNMAVYEVVKVRWEKHARRMIYSRADGAVNFALKVNQKVINRVS